MCNPSKLETNFTRLLSQCDRLVSEDKMNDWRFETYVTSLETMLSDLKQHPSCPKSEVLAEYTRHVEFLKGILHTEKLPTVSEKALANQFISPGPTTSTQKITKEIQMKTRGKYANEMRRELLGNDELQLQTTLEEPENDYDAMLKYHQRMQEKVAEEMVGFARSLKETSLLAGSIIRKDTEVIEKSNKFTDQNYDRLKVESGRLDQHTKKTCNLWIWMMLVGVCASFMWMIMFMKMFPKKLTT